ncbi:HPr(Ser) kinase/phosphatase [Derxia gummosa]|uniref:HPr kinase/phosphorylase n=1 Tax=Derxia gummosa DSM 723 TaxID=1121388 RepID=A0A8B6X0K7_9BURK|nr:HPr(Ser) kinase/phosphatase [Derxia gummosa]
MLTIRRLYDENEYPLHLRRLAGSAGESAAISAPRAPDGMVAASDLVGHFNIIHPGRIQVYGHQEVEYVAPLDKTYHTLKTKELIARKPPAVIVGDSLEVDPDVIAACEEHGVPLYASAASAAEVIDVLRIWLAKRLAPTTTVHGVFMDVLGIGVLITGESGLGKSELALELISRGHGLVADDAVDLARISPNTIEGRCPPLLQNLLEVRGLGLLDIKAIFGETAVRRKMRLRLIVHLVRRQTMDTEYERLPLEALTQTVLGLPVRKVVIPVAAGRNIAVLLEAAVRNTVLQLRGIDTMREFIERQKAAMQSFAR